jgi:hypothetical protein
MPAVPTVHESGQGRTGKISASIMRRCRYIAIRPQAPSSNALFCIFQPALRSLLTELHFCLLLESPQQAQLIIYTFLLLSYQEMARDGGSFDFKLYRYVPSLATAIIATTLFGGLLAAHTFRLVRNKTWFRIPFAVGGVCALPCLPFEIAHILTATPQSKQSATSAASSRITTTLRSAPTSCNRCSSCSAPPSLQPAST